MYIYFLISIAVLSLAVFGLPSRVKQPFVMVLMLAVAGVSLWKAGGVLINGGQELLGIGSNIVFGTTVFAIDRLTAFFMVMLSLAAVSVAIYSHGYLKGYVSQKKPAQMSLHLSSMAVLYVSMLFVVICRDGYGFLLSWELMTVSSFMLILFDAQRREVRRAALAYLILMHIGFVFLVAGFAALSAEGLPVTFDSLGEYFREKPVLPVFLLFLIGFGMKAGIFPLHTWLPEAHPAAPAHISAFMSGVMIKMGVYGIVRVISHIDTGLFAPGMILFVAGIVTGLWGAILAAVQNDMKRLLAYSSIENIGIIFAGIGISAIGHATGNDFLALCGMGGALLHTLNHSFFKPLLFFGAGNVYTATHTTELESLGGISRKMPFTTVLFLTGVIAITALPPFNGFVSEFIIYFGMFDAVSQDAGGVIASICGIVALSLIGGVVMLAFTKLFGVTFLGSPRSHAVDHADEVGTSRLLACVIPVAGIIVVGFTPGVFMEWTTGLAGDFLGIGDDRIRTYILERPLQQFTIASAVLVSTILLLFLYRTMKLRKRKVERSPVWGCGFSTSSHKMQYSGESFSEGLYGISTSLTKNSGGGEVVDKNEVFPTRHSFDLRHKDKVSTLFSQWWVEAVRRVNLRVLRLNTGKVNHYILYSLLFLVLILLLTVTGII